MGTSDDSKLEPEQFRKLFIGGLDYRTTDDTLKSFFEKWGEIVDVVVMKDPNTKRSRGFGFITYSKSDMVDEAMANRPHKVDGREVESKRAVPRDEIGRPEAGLTTKKMFVGGIKEQEEDDLREYFKQFGNILNVNIVMDKDTNTKRGFAFIEYDDHDCVDKAVLKKHHIVAGKTVDVKKAMSKTDMSSRGRGSGGGGGGGGGRWERGGGDSWGGRSSGGGSWGGKGNNYRDGPRDGPGGNWGPDDRWGNGPSNDRWGNGPSNDRWGNGPDNDRWGNGPPSNDRWGNGPDNEWGGGPGNGYGGGGGGSGGGGNWGNNDYQQGYGGGPVRNNYGGSNRNAPYGSQRGGGGYGGGGGGGGGYGNRRY